MEIEFNKPYTYKEICEIMGEERQSGGDHIKKQLNRWRKKYIIDKPNKRGSKYTILGEKTIYDWKYKDSFMVNIKDKDKGGVYLIKYDDYVYIGQTKNFRKRMLGHIEKNRTYTNLLIDNGGKFYLLAIENDLDKRLELEKKYIQQYIDMGFCVINRDLNKNVQTKYKRKNITYKNTSYKNIKIPIKDLEFVKTLLKENNIEWK